MAAMSNTDLLRLIDDYKYEPDQLVLEVANSPHLEEGLCAILQPIAQNTAWPNEFRTWKMLLLGLIGSEIGGIANPLLREKAADILFAVAEKWGFNRAAVVMIAGESEGVRRDLASDRISNK